MKRIVNGVTYNTATSTVCARLEWENKDHNGITQEFGEDILYQTRGGAFFVHEEKTMNEWDENERETRQRVRHEFVPMCPESANKWMLEGDVEVINNPFEDPPEATAEAEPGATIYIRVPAGLKRRVDEAARDNKVSGNAWAMRCVEQCLADEDRGDATTTAGKVGDVMSVTGGFGFTLHDDKNGGINTPCMTLAYATRSDAEAARKLVVKAFAWAKSAIAPAWR